MSKQILKTACAAALIAGAAMGGSARAADQSPAYVGADVGAQLNRKEGTIARVYAGYNLGGTVAFDLAQVHALELMVFASRTESRHYDIGFPGLFLGGDRVHTTGLGVNWTTQTKLNDNWSVTSRLGANYAWATTRYAYSNSSYTYDRAGVTAGLGVAYKLNPHLSLTLDVSYMPIRINRDDKNTTPTLGTGLRYNF